MDRRVPSHVVAHEAVDVSSRFSDTPRRRGSFTLTEKIEKKRKARGREDLSQSSPNADPTTVACWVRHVERLEVRRSLNTPAHRPGEVDHVAPSDFDAVESPDLGDQEDPVVPRVGAASELKVVPNVAR